MGGRLTMRGAKEAAAAARRGLSQMDLGQTAVLRRLADLFRKGEEQIFSTYGSIIGRRWAPLAESTARARLRLAQRFGLRISARDPRLVLFGDMKRALTRPGPAHHVRVVGRRVSVEIDQTAINQHNRSTGAATGFTKKGRPRKVRTKAGRYPENIIDLHEEGSANRPARQVVGIPPGVKRDMDREVKKYLDRISDLAMGGR